MFKKRFNTPFIVSEHHEIICQELQDLVDGTSVSNIGQAGSTELLIINVPPRYGKTELAIINFVPWCFARNASCKFIHLSYAEKLALDNSSQARELMKHETYQQLWPIEWKVDSDAKGLWKTNEGGGLMASPAGGTITGFGAGSTALGAFGAGFSGAISIDDPLKPDDARSDVERANVNERLVNTVMSRRNSRETPIILIMQRLHEDDMTGFVLSGRTGLRVRHIKLAAIKPDGTALWAHKHTLEELSAIKAASPYMFSGQYQQEPAPEEGVYFTRPMFKEYEILPPNLRVYGASDYAVTEGGGDWTVHGVFGVDGNNDIYVLDWWRQQTAADAWVEAFLNLSAMHKPVLWGEERGQIIKSVGPYIERRMQERRIYVMRKDYASATDKPTRARAIQARMNMKGLYVPKGKPWVADLMTECLNFPNGKHDDQVDVLSKLGQMLEDVDGTHIAPINISRRHIV